MIGKNEKIIILIPVFNDWSSLNKLLIEINDNIKDLKNINFECFIVNDASTINKPDLKNQITLNLCKS